MKKVILFGDSIRLGYRATVAQELQGQAEVWSPDENCENSLRILTYWSTWLKDKSPDVLHLNCGLHDIKTISASTRELLVPLDFYKRNLNWILDLLQERIPTTKLIFATTTPVLQDVTSSPDRGFHRYNSDILAINQAAKEICERHRVEVNDLHSLVLEQGPENMINPDGVHYDEAQSQILGRAVAAKIRSSF